MIAYIVRRITYAIPILLGVNLLTFSLFFFVNSPEDMARLHLGVKRVSADAIASWKAAHGYDKPLFFSPDAAGLDKLSQTLFFQHSLRLFIFDFGQADDGRDISRDILTRMGPSLSIALPTLVIGLLIHLSVALFLVMVRGSRLDALGVVLSVALMSISTLFFVIGGQLLFSKLLNLVPISGYDSGWSAARFVILPISIGVISGLGATVRLYRSFFLEESEKDYVRTARAKGLSETAILFRHILPNALIPILTGVVVVIPFLFTGSLIMESFFGIPGLGSYLIDAINHQDFSIVRAMVFLGSVLYILGLILTDISYTIADPRIRLN